jgi:hypothetical protein
MTAVLASGSVYQYWFPSYTSFMGQPVNGSKTGTSSNKLWAYTGENFILPSASKNLSPA